MSQKKANGSNDIQNQIINLEKKLLKVATDEVKELYFEIEFLCCKQNELQNIYQ